MVKVMVFGTFDNLHPGHMHFLKESRKHGDHLVLVLARDNTVEKIKHNKPLHDEHQRKSTIESTGIVDKVLLGDEPASYRHIIEQKPDIICLGYDQHSRDVEKVFPKIKFIRISSHYPEKYKSSKIRPK